MMQLGKRLSFSTWNINGIHNKLIGDKTKCLDFINAISKHDFVLLTETWSTTVPEIEGYYDFTIHPQKTNLGMSKHSGRNSGGVSLLYKKCYKNNIDLINSSKSYLWCKISKNIIEKQKDLYLCGIYIPPENSKYFDSEIFDNLQNEIAEFSNKGFVTLLGDFNARTGKELDSVSKEGGNFLKNDQSFLSLTPPPRSNIDTKLNHMDKDS